MKLSVITPSHNPRWLAETWASLKTQTHTDFEWVVAPNGLHRAAVVDAIREFADPRIRSIALDVPDGRIGAIKRAAFMAGEGEVLVELDHDDLLVPTALAEIAQAAAAHDEAGFFYSDHADFDGGVVSGQGLPVTYMTNLHDAWKANGFRFYEHDIEGVRPGRYTCVHAFEPTARALSLIFWAPNHVRAWRRSTYHALGGHNTALGICDDHELLVRTYLVDRMHHIPKPLYLYRVSGENTWAPQAARIDTITREIMAANLEKLVLREAKLRGLPVYDLGGGIDGAPGWTTVDRVNADVRADLRGRWPWQDSTVFAFRAHDLLEHLPDKLHTMREIHRCLVPGGWLLSSTPSTDGRGAFQDPTHVSYWNQNAFWYWTRRAQARYIHNDNHRFQEARLFTHLPSAWHAENNIPYVVADLIALKDDYHGPGENFI